MDTLRDRASPPLAIGSRPVTELIVTMDGPAGTGKSTASRAVASILALPPLDTGAFYRAAGLIAVDHEVDLDDGPAVAAAVATHDLDQDAGRMLVDGRDVSERIRTAEMSRASSMVSAHPEVRSLLVQRQREWVDRHGDRAVAGRKR